MKWLKVGAVVFCAVTITALGIDATDTLTGKGGTMLGQLIMTNDGVCPKGMVEVSAALSFTCIDKYEASAGEGCPAADPKGQLQTEENLNTSECGAVSQPEVNPWRFITREQAAIACARSGKRLPTGSEWYQGALGTIDSETNCNIDSGTFKITGENQDCVSAHGAEDMIGNVWEWIEGDVINGEYKGRKMPEEGYVGQVDGEGVAVLTTNKPSHLFNDDYLWSRPEGVFGILRGGFYGSESDAGLYAVHAETLPTSLGTAIGFRCVK